jgi:hypothetical protein
MPQVQNNFLKSRMNKDLDARLLPNGEYRDARDVSISKSEGSDVGALENIRGTLSITSFGLTDKNLEIIGIHSDVSSNRIFCFITNYNDASTNQLENSAALFGNAKCYIAMYDANVKSGNVLVSGNYLNFSKTHRVYGINVLEDLLFWTDNRNQPRKININKAFTDSSYYNSEDLISVLKYAPYKPIRFTENLTARTNVNDLYQSTLINDTDNKLTPHFTAPAIANNSTVAIDFSANTVPDFNGTLSDFCKIGPGSASTNPASPRYFIRNKTQESAWYFITQVIGGEVSIGLAPYTIITGATTPSWGTITNGWSYNSAAPDAYEIAIANPYYNPGFSGDPDFLKDKFVRFSYRFKFEDGEYSLAAPFTQPAFLSNQYGNWLESDEFRTKENGIVDFFENQLTTAGCTINLPYNYDELYDKLNVVGIDILYKESTSNNIKVIESIDTSEFSNYIGAAVNSKDPSTLVGGDLNNSTITFSATTAFLPAYHYPTTIVATGNGKQIRLEVYITANNAIQDIKCTSSGSGFNAGDILIIPANELGEGSPQVTITLSGGDLVGWTGTSPDFTPTNIRKDQFLFQYKSTEPYKVLPEKDTTRVHDKAPIRAMSQEITGNRVLYGNYINRNNAPSYIDYSVKINEKFSLDKSKDNLISRIEYPQQTLKQNRTYQVGIVLVDRFGRASNVLLNNNILTNDNTSVRDSTIFTGYSNANNNAVTWPGNSMKVVFASLISDAKATGGLYSNSNPLGWYSYRIVIKQQDQDYYNVYVPGVLAGKLVWSGKARPAYFSTKTVTNIALLGDNVNKIPRNLSEAGPMDTNYGSSMILFNRINPNSGTVATDDESVYNRQTPTDSAINKLPITNIKSFLNFDDWAPTKGQFYPGKENVSDANLGDIAPWYPYYSANTPPTTFNEVKFNDIFYKAGENPSIATITTPYRIGTTPSYGSENNITVATRAIGVFETTPVKSNLNILWETTTSGLISELNTSINTTAANSGLGGITKFGFTQNESMSAGDFVVTNEFEVVDSNGSTTADWLSTIDLLEVSTDSGNTLLTDAYQVVQTTAGVAGSQSPRFKIRLSNQAGYTPPDFFYKGIAAFDQITFILRLKANGITSTHSFIGDLSNTAPSITGDTPFSSVTTAFANYPSTGEPLRITDLWNLPVGIGHWDSDYYFITGGLCWDVSQAPFNGNSIEIIDFDSEFWRYWSPQIVQRGSSSTYQFDQDVSSRSRTSKSYYLQNGCARGIYPTATSGNDKAVRTYGLQIIITRVDTSTVSYKNDGSYNPQWGASNQLGSWVGNPTQSFEKSINKAPFIIDSSGRKMVTSTNYPPSLAGNHAQSSGYQGYNITYRISYHVKEDFQGGQISPTYYAYVRFYENQIV